MPTPMIPESPSARVLLELAASAADARVTMSGRAVLLRGGAIADVAALPGDLSFGEFLLAAGRIEQRDLEAVVQCADEHCIGLDQALRELEVVSEEVLYTTRRALLLDRLARAFASEEQAPGPPPDATALSQVALDTAFSTPELVLDALVRRAALGMAETIGALPTARFVWLETPAQRKAAEWADLGDIPIAVSLATLFLRHPSAPSRIAALLRAGLAMLDVSEYAQALSAAPQPAVDARGATMELVAGHEHEAGEPASDSAHAAAPAEAEPADAEGEAEGSHVGEREAEPAAPDDAQGPRRGPLGLAPVPCWLAPPRNALNDPLAAPEARAAELEGAGAEPPVLASAWLDLAAGWLAHQRSFVEAARAAREAAAADPSDARALAAAATYTAAAGDPEVAVAYGLAWADHAGPEEEQARALEALADFASRAGSPERALDALRRAAGLLPGDASAHEKLARALADAGDVQLAVEHARKAAELLREPSPNRARALLEWATQLTPGNLRVWNELARILSQNGRTSAAIATLACAARAQSDSALRERLRTSAIHAAEVSNRSDLASELLLEALDTSDVLERLLENLYDAEEWATLAVIASEAAAGSAGPERATLLIHAAEASFALDEVERARLLLEEAVVSDPGHAEAFDRLGALAQRTEQPGLVRDALERAVRTRCPDRAAARALEGSRRDEVLELCERLSLLLTEPEGAPLSRFTAELLYELDGRTLGLEEARAQESSLAAFEAEREECERALRSAPAQARAEPALLLAALCRLDPARRVAARRLYEKVLSIDPSQQRALRELTSLLQLERDVPALRALYEAESALRVELQPLLDLAYLEREEGNLATALDVCWRAIASSCRDAQLLMLAVRLARALGEQEREHEALRMLSETRMPSGQRARVRMRLARAQRTRGELDTAVQSACAALAIDPECAEAALMVVAECDSLAPSDRAPALSLARRSLGDSAELLHKLARALYVGANADAQCEALSSLRAICPRDPFPARALVALFSTGRDPRVLAEALRAALSPECFSRETLYVAQRGLGRLAELGEARLAGEIVLSALPWLGERSRPLLAWAEATALSSGAADLACALLEQRAALADGEERLARLAELAERYQEAGTLWAAARTRLRLLALCPDDARSLAALAQIYAETQETERLRAVLEARIERAEDDDARRERIFELALCALYFEDDRERGAALVERALVRTAGNDNSEHEEVVPLAALCRGVGLLRAAAPERAFRLLLELSRREPSRRRELLEEALVLAESDLEDPALAFEAALVGTLAHPEHEPLVSALGRWARPLSRVDVWADALETAAERAATLERQAELLLRAAKLCEEDLNDGPRACDMLDRAYRATPTPEIEQLAVAGAARLYRRDLRAGKRAYDRLRDTLHVRAKFGTALERARALVTLSRLADEVYLAREDASGYADAAAAALAGTDDAPAEEREVVRALLDQRIAESAEQRESAQASRATGPARPSFAEEASLFRGFLPAAPTLRPQGASLAPPTLRPHGPSLLPSHSSFDIRARGVAVTVLPSGESVHAASTVREIEREEHTGPALSQPDVVEALVSGEASALEELARQVQRDPKGAPSICAQLLTRVRGGALSTSTLRGLRVLSAAANEHALWRTCSQALAFSEPQLRPPSGVRRRGATGRAAEAALAAARATEHQAEFALLALLVEAAAPLFRCNMATVLSSKEAPEPLREAPYAQLLGELGAMFGARLDAYSIPSGEDRVSLCSAQPANILIGDRTPRDTAALRFRLARAYECARPEHVLLATLAPEDVEALFAALRAAFGPAAAHSRAEVSRQAAALAADFWRTMPSGAQRSLTGALAELTEPLTVAPLLADVRLVSAKVALFATRELDVALAQLGRDLDAGEAAPPAGTPAKDGLERALASDAQLRELVTFALSDPYLQSLDDSEA